MKMLGMAAAASLAVLGTAGMAADFNGDGTGDIAIFRPSSGLWSVRNITRFYAGSTGDDPVPGDYSGSGRDQAAIYRSSQGLWAVRDVTRVYFGGGSDLPLPGDYDGDGACEMGVYRPSVGLWAVNDLTRTYFGVSTDVALAPGKPFSRGLLKTGQTFSYQTGDDGYFEIGKDLQYTDHGDGTVTDGATGLMWAKDGDAAGCNFGNQTDWSSAVRWAQSVIFAGYRDWRLPNRRELDSLVDAGRNTPSVNPIFTNTKSNYYWSSTTCNDGISSAWDVYFVGGTLFSDAKTALHYVRAVRGGK